MAIAPDGTVGKASIFARLTGGVGPGGLAVDQAGNLFVTHPGFGAVWGYNRRGEVIFRIDSPVGYELTNLAFGGPDGSTLFITEGGGDILASELPERGVPMYSHSA
jgi:gluconolactonase